MSLTTSIRTVRRVLFGSALAGSLAAAGFTSTPVLAQDGLPIIAQYVMPQDLEGASREAYLEAVTNAVRAEPERAAEITEAALKFRFDDIQLTPGLATDIVLAALAGVENLTVAAVVAILDAAVGALQGLPVDLSHVSQDVIKAALAALPPDIADGVKQQVLEMPSGALREQMAFIYTVPPTGGEPTPSPTPEPTPEEEEEPTEPPVTPIMP